MLEGGVLEHGDVQAYLKHHRKSEKLFQDEVRSHPQEDFTICTDVDRYNFVVEVQKEQGRIALVCS